MHSKVNLVEKACSELRGRSAPSPRLGSATLATFRSPGPLQFHQRLLHALLRVGQVHVGEVHLEGLQETQGQANGSPITEPGAAAAAAAAQQTHVFFFLVRCGRLLPHVVAGVGHTFLRERTHQSKKCEMCKKHKLMSRRSASEYAPAATLQYLHSSGRNSLSSPAEQHTRNGKKKWPVHFF